MLEHRQALVVVHGQHDIVGSQVTRHEQRVGGYRAIDVQPHCAGLRDRGADDALFFVAEMPTLAGVWIEAAHRDARSREAPIVLQIL